ncbi:hypothetical protein [Fluviicola sp.]|uniref:hypothetical protein n=1 Tax=Fluviicola sp. TaxID=1917219 RepID=UPI00261A950E|nr:hypothetical protein [Fluviicola sp.]
MKQSISILIGLLWMSFSVFAQKETNTLNTKENLFAANESGKFVSATSSSIQSTENVTVTVDTLTPASFEFYCHIFPKETVVETYPGGYSDTIVYRGCRNIPAFQVRIDYKGEDKIEIQIEDGKLVAVQQALDSAGNWISLEHFIHSDCGNNYSFARLKKNESYLFKIAQYTGNYPTKMRLKILIDDQVYYSNEFNGSINNEQLNSSYNRKENETIFR